MRRRREQLQSIEILTPPVPAEELPGVLDRISDSVAREVYRRKRELRIELSSFTLPDVHAWGDDDE